MGKALSGQQDEDEGVEDVSGGQRDGILAGTTGWGAESTFARGVG